MKEKSISWLIVSLTLFAAILNIEQASPTNDFCKIDYRVALGIIVSNGCATTGYDCDDLRLFLSELVEKVYNPMYTTVVIFEDNLSGGSEIYGTRESVISSIQSLDCGGNVDEIDYDGTLKTVFENLNDTKAFFDEEKVVIISLCEAEVDDSSCSLPGILDDDGGVEITVINIGSDVSNSHQFVCLVNGGSISSPNYNEYQTLNDAIYDTDHLEEEICKRRRPTPAPTDKPTESPTPRGPTHDFCEEIDFTMGLRIIVSTGCELYDDECTAVKEFVADVVEKTYDPRFVTMTVVAHGLGRSIIEISGTREQILDGIDLLICGNPGDDDDVNYGAALKDALSDLVGSGFEEKKIVMMSFCEADAFDDTCDVQDILDSNNEVEIIVVNAGGKNVDNQFSCLVNGNSEQLFNFPTIDEETLLPGADGVETEVCEKPTPRLI